MVIEIKTPVFWRPSPNMAMDSDQQQQEAALPLVVVARSSLRWLGAWLAAQRDASQTPANA
jgi:hypothetical protein